LEDNRKEPKLEIPKTKGAVNYLGVYGTDPTGWVRDERRGIGYLVE